MVTIYTNKDFLEIFGLISVRFATLDFLATNLFFNLVVSKNKINSIDDKTTLGQKLKLLKELKPKDVKDGNILKELSGFIQEAIKIAEERNRYMHDQWVFDKEKISLGKISRFKIIKVGLHFKIIKDKELAIEEINDFSEKIYRMQGFFGQLLEKMGLKK